MSKTKKLAQPSKFLEEQNKSSQLSKFLEEQPKKIIASFRNSLETKQKSFYHNCWNWQTVVFVLRFINCYKSTSLKSNRN